VTPNIASWSIGHHLQRAQQQTSICLDLIYTAKNTLTYEKCNIYASPLVRRVASNYIVTARNLGTDELAFLPILVVITLPSGVTVPFLILIHYKEIYT
jgi:hypothetical protein